MNFIGLISGLKMLVLMAVLITSTMTPSTWLCLHRKCPYTRAFGQLLRIYWRVPLPSHNGQDGISFFPQIWRLAGLSRVSYIAYTKNVMWFISGCQKLAHVFFHNTIFSHLVHAPCWPKLTIRLKLASSMLAHSSPWRRC